MVPIFHGRWLWCTVWAAGEAVCPAFLHRVVTFLRLHAAVAGRRVHTYLWLDAKYQPHLALV
jgi:hypothetical protein